MAGFLVNSFNILVKFGMIKYNNLDFINDKCENNVVKDEMYMFNVQCFFYSIKIMTIIL